MIVITQKVVQESREVIIDSNIDDQKVEEEPTEEIVGENIGINVNVTTVDRKRVHEEEIDLLNIENYYINIYYDYYNFVFCDNFLDSFFNNSKEVFSIIIYRCIDRGKKLKSTMNNLLVSIGQITIILI